MTDSSATPSDDALVLLRGVVYQKLGRCLVRLQQYELLMKDFVSKARVEGSADSITESLTARAESFARQTLGQVSAAFASTVLEEPVWAADGFPMTVAPADDDRARIGTAFSITGSDAELERLRADMEALVNIRNGLVHVFVARHDLWEIEGCHAASDELDATYEVIDARFRELLDLYNAVLLR